MNIANDADYPVPPQPTTEDAELRRVGFEPEFSGISLEAAAAAGDTLVVPVEAICPPIPVERLQLLDPMVHALRRAGASACAMKPTATNSTR